MKIDGDEKELLESVERREWNSAASGGIARVASSFPLDGGVMSHGA